jgi:NADPH:quinone reductase-like Zn-dependent oxidoreductase
VEVSTHAKAGSECARGCDVAQLGGAPNAATGRGEALVRVHAAAITRDELDWPEGRLPATPSYEFSGVVDAVGPDVDQLGPGAAVYALSSFDRDGAAADYIALPAKYLAPKPNALDHIAAAAVPLAGLSAWQGLFEHGRLTAGERVLIHGAAGGVGGFAVQLARARDAYVIGTASGDNVQAALELGAHEVVDHAGARFENEFEPVDLMFDTAAGERLERSPAVLRRGAGSSRSWPSLRSARPNDRSRPLTSSSSPIGCS